MSNNLENSADYIVSNEILLQRGEFTFDTIVTSLTSRLNSFFDTMDAIKLFIEKKIEALCNVGLVSYTGLYYYVN